ncbi:DUF3889 domain-containing protein [Cohnella sp. AR92]|nr:DUF3889 domain-containing protein [Cohnella sp. AR92]
MAATLISLAVGFASSVSGNSALAYNPENPFSKPEPDYAKWGRVAIAKIKELYPRASIVDYSHVGREALTKTTAQETFKMWLREGSREFGVHVRIVFDSQTDRLLRISIRTTK